MLNADNSDEPQVAQKLHVRPAIGSVVVARHCTTKSAAACTQSADAQPRLAESVREQVARARAHTHTHTRLHDKLGIRARIVNPYSWLDLTEREYRYSALLMLRS